MTDESRLVAVVLEVRDLDRSAELYTRAFGIDLQPSDHGGQDRWTSGPHAAVSWSEGALMHFALYQARGPEPTARAQISFAVADLSRAHALAVQEGAEVVHEPRAEEWGQSARYRDYDGNVIELTQPA